MVHIAKPRIIEKIRFFAEENAEYHRECRKMGWKEKFRCAFVYHVATKIS